jgi:hypothetical protein
MRKLAVLASALLGALSFACGRVAVQPLNLPAGCVDAGDATSYTFKVDDQAQVVPACLGVHAGRTNLEWSGNANVRKTLIAFKENTPQPPVDPPCANANCRLNKRDHETRFGDFYYTVVVIQKNGKPVANDPRLIIQP